jgi:hypothetical protein
MSSEAGDTLTGDQEVTRRAEVRTLLCGGEMAEASGALSQSRLMNTKSLRSDSDYFRPTCLTSFLIG